jgi:hypothetical protein
VSLIAVGKHTEAQIIAALKQVEAGRATEDVALIDGAGYWLRLSETRALEGNYLNP